jgi:hypothetical protein
MVTGDLQNFPVLISVVSSDFIDNAQSDGDDFVIISDKNSIIYNHEIEIYDSSSGNLVTWVNIPYLSSNVDTILYLYYGNSNCSSQQNPGDVWDSDYIHVWHLGDNLKDSAGSDDGNDHGTSKVAGKIGKARDFEQSEGDFIDFGDMDQPADASLTTMTWEAWVKPESKNIILMSKYNRIGTNTELSYIISFTSTDIFVNYAYSLTGYTRSFTIDSYCVVDQWIYLTSTWTLGGTNDIDPFINGIEVSDTQDSSNGDYMRNTPITDDIGRIRTHDGTEYTDAIIDEVRWSKVVRSDAWINTSFNTMNDPSSFFNISDQETNNFPPNKPTIDGQTMGKPGIEYEYYAKTTDPDGDQVYYKWDWGDGSFSEWLGPYDSGVKIPASHSWSQGSYEIKVKAKDTGGLESEWSDPYPITMPKDKTRIFSLFLYLIERFPLLERLNSFFRV